jgi:putative PEP-CTERM system histidine kinase
MSAFVVHDLKNIMSQLSLMLSNAKRLRDNPEFHQDILITVESSLEKIRQLMVQLRGGEAPPAGRHGVDLAAIAGRIAAQASTRGRQLELDVAESVLTRGHEERIERVLGHMVQNAFDATPAEGRVWLKLERASGQARLEIGDTGHGMTQEFIESRLFKPFQTTKAQGMGIGSYESFQYVQELGGKIQVRSAPDEGTVLSITLPLLESRREADLYALSAK